MTELKNNIIEKIKAGEVVMRPKWHFVFQTLMYIVSAGIIATLSVYFISFIAFALHKSGMLFAPGFGMPGLGFFLMSSPWFLISLTGLFILLLYILVTHFSVSYKRPLVYSMLAVVCFVVLLSSFIHYSAMHERIGTFAERHHMPGLMPFYENAQKRPEGVTLGMVGEMRSQEFVLQTEKDEELLVRINERTKIPPHTLLKTGEHVLVFGPREGDTVTAFGIKSVPEDFARCFKHCMMRKE